MDPSELLRLVTGILEGLALRYLVTGSTATIFYGDVGHRVQGRRRRPKALVSWAALSLPQGRR